MDARPVISTISSISFRGQSVVEHFRGFYVRVHADQPGVCQVQSAPAYTIAFLISFYGLTQQPQIIFSVGALRARWRTGPLGQHDTGIARPCKRDGGAGGPGAVAVRSSLPLLASQPDEREGSTVSAPREWGRGWGSV